ncbi:MAG: primosomal protein N' [Bacteroidaceae bacterium]|nr:primosomal protein N' [Bacteroidaceae bacterium]
MSAITSTQAPPAVGDGRGATFVDVILPLPLAAAFTYRLPSEFEGQAAVGCRVTVPFGNKKLYSAIVVRLHHQPPHGCAVKEVLEVIDASPILLPQQLELWQWIADYYLCTLGDVYKAALPSGMKLESESVVALNPDYEPDATLRPSERTVLLALQGKLEQKVAELQKATAVRNILPVVKQLLERGAVVMKEEIKRTYKPKTVACVRLTEAFFSEAELTRVLGEMHQRSPKQEALLLRYLDVAQASVALRMANPQLLVEVEKQALLREFSQAVLSAVRDKGVLEVYEKTVGRLAADVLPQDLKLRALSPAQQTAHDAICRAWEQHPVCLLHGVTSSGKTEVYIHLIKEAIDRGEQVLYLLPEIVLTAQLVERLKRVFGDRLGVYHSKYPDAERVEVWQKQLSDQPYDILVGVRSSVFLPFQRLGLVIVDEEHETSFKQQDPAPRYHARNVALVLAAKVGARTLLGTATPSLESYYQTQQGRYGLVELTERYQQLQLPEIRVADVKELRRKKLMKGLFSPELHTAIRTALERGEQVILFQNRRGYAPQMECHTCGWTPRCQSCDVSLTYHKGTRAMTCHYCGSSYPVPMQCPNCEGRELSTIGYGTERVEDLVHEAFPAARIGRMDLDTTRSREAYEQIIADFQHGRTDILVGTQMVTKGLDFERVSVVGILNADTMLNMPDFRAYERAFQMLSQVAGRAGRHGRRGLVILQTKSPDAEVVAQILHNDYAGLYSSQMEERLAFRYPPFTRLTYVFVKHRDVQVVEQLAHQLSQLLRQVFSTRVQGPVVPPVGRVKLFYIRQFSLKVETTVDARQVRQRLAQIQAYLLSLPQYKSAQVYYDVDPV